MRFLKVKLLKITPLILSLIFGLHFLLKNLLLLSDLISNISIYFF